MGELRQNKGEQEMLKQIARLVWRCGAKKLGARLMSYALDRDYHKWVNSHKED